MNADDPNRTGAAPPVAPMITAAEVYPVLERRALKAQAQIALLFRIFDTRTRLRTPEARAAADGDDWAALLVALAARGIRIRLQTSDFDPIAAASLHREAWASLRHLAERVRAVPEAAGRIEAMAARHPAELGAAWRRVFAGRARKRLALIRNHASGDVAISHPGLRPVLAGGAPRLFPASHHQKLAVIDDNFAIAGGLDIDERRWDTPEHAQSADETWRDVSLALEADAATPVAEAAARIWTDCARDWRARDEGGDLLGGLATPTPWTLRPADAAHPHVEVVTTRSVARAGLFAFAPRTVNDGTQRATLDLIGRARRFLYVETQFLRSRIITEALVAAARDAPELELAIVLPFAPESFAFDGHRGMAIRHGEALQARMLRRVGRAFGDRVAVLSPAKPTRRAPDDAFIAYGAGMIYVHSKVMIADAAEAMIGSANLNGRSMRWDTELTICWRDAPAVAAFLDELATSWLGADTGPANRLATWREAAAANSVAPPERRKGFLLPHNPKRAARFGRLSMWLPDDMF
ncbi:cardiolipin synthase [Pikeienuella piscinae]|uniref:Phospholipase D n=1 Tax=Pikeienuella piscinae TaxID=2748098 RepID=A0A7L5BZJ4_9RHOB|nr:phospholipase D-like domain-containing protein [Pikeienuella piscinae]QIE55686.1 cardiolipin synthase [Pikeienuella piscinae]